MGPPTPQTTWVGVPPAPANRSALEAAARVFVGIAKRIAEWLLGQRGPSAATTPHPVQSFTRPRAMRRPRSVSNGGLNSAAKIAILAASALLGGLPGMAIAGGAIAYANRKHQARQAAGPTRALARQPGRHAGARSPVAGGARAAQMGKPVIVINIHVHMPVAQLRGTQATVPGALARHPRTLAARGGVADPGRRPGQMHARPTTPKGTNTPQHRAVSPRPTFSGLGGRR